MEIPIQGRSVPVLGVHSRPQVHQLQLLLHRQSLILLLLVNRHIGHIWLLMLHLHIHWVHLLSPRCCISKVKPVLGAPILYRVLGVFNFLLELGHQEGVFLGLEFLSGIISDMHNQVVVVVFGEYAKYGSDTRSVGTGSYFFFRETKY